MLDGQRVDALRRCTVVRGTDELIPSAARNGPIRERDGNRGTGDVVFAQVGGERPAAADALEARIGDLLREPRCP